MSSNSSSELASNASQVIGSLPIELLPEILSRLSWRTGDLAACARVNSSWHNYAQLLLYERILLRDQLKLIKLFRSLAAHEHNARSLRIIGACPSGRRRRRCLWTGLKLRNLLSCSTRNSRIPVRTARRRARTTGSGYGPLATRRNTPLLANLDACRIAQRPSPTGALPTLTEATSVVHYGEQPYLEP